MHKTSGNMWLDETAISIDTEADAGNPAIKSTEPLLKRE